MALTVVLLVGGGAALTGALAGLSLSASTTGEVTDVEQRGDSTRVVLFCDGIDARLPRWQVLARAPGGPAASEVVVRIAGTDGHVPEDVTTTLGPTLEAVGHFAATGARVPDHAWRSDARTGDLRPPALDGAGAL